jgi:hypothetical protein
MIGHRIHLIRRGAPRSTRYAYAVHASYNLSSGDCHSLEPVPLGELGDDMGKGAVARLVQMIAMLGVPHTRWGRSAQRLAHGRAAV